MSTRSGQAYRAPGLSRLHKPITHSMHRIEVFRAGAELLSQAAHVGIDGAVSMSYDIPDIAQELLAGLTRPRLCASTVSSLNSVPSTQLPCAPAYTWRGDR